ncbi:MAG: restriction endonuclease [Flavobacteriaceae bacterium]|nr:restriction endonuclease [Flavobacteriaceae bacterium]
MKTHKVFEHQFYSWKELNLDENDKKSLHAFNAKHDKKFFNLQYNGIQFKEYVGVLQVNAITIEVLPKIDNRPSVDEKSLWRGVLLEMLKATLKLNPTVTNYSSLKTSQNSFIELLFDLYLNELQKLFRRGLQRKYDRYSQNLTALKGKLMFSKHLRKNYIHKERFYTSHIKYEYDHLIHQILFDALKIVQRYSTGSILYGKCLQLLERFPNVSNIQLTDKTFSKVKLEGKTRIYERGFKLAKWIIQGYNPDIVIGNNKMVAILFDMNQLWEEYILIQLQKSSRRFNSKVQGQKSKRFWGNNQLKPDIYVQSMNMESFIIDTKWKRYIDNPSTSDLRQMFVYNKFWNVKKSFLLYPTATSDQPNLKVKSFESPQERLSCGILKANVISENKLNKRIGEQIFESISEIKPD